MWLQFPAALITNLADGRVATGQARPVCGSCFHRAEFPLLNRVRTHLYQDLLVLFGTVGTEKYEEKYVLSTTIFAENDR